eukprot:GEMP01035924.1.p1 GENE.GEMP01035924.1~~GEMP01035924.1.p1  ORF type:complete len:477 (+),score=102.19 GEMP01035924.1:49-1479(+)
MESCLAGVVVGATAVGGGSSLLSWFRRITSTNPKIEDALPEKKSGVAGGAQVRKTPELKGERNGPKVSSRARLRDQPADIESIGMGGAKLNVKDFVDLLEKLIGETKYLQNNPKMGVHPEEARAAKHVFDFLAPYSTENGGPLKMERLEYVPGRTNIKIKYPGETSKNIGFIGSHMDVVPANPELWDRDPFVLTVEGDRCYGRGTTDCLCHVALLSCLLKDLCLRRAKVKKSIVIVFIAGEEGGETGVGVDRVMEAGKLDELQAGPLYWIDAADSQPCAGTFGVLQWTLKATGRLFHSGMPHKTINPIELLHESLNIMQQRFYDDFGPRYEEKRWGFASSSTMKPTQTECAKGSLNQIPPWATCSGDIRLSPFYNVHEAIDKVEQYINDINENLESVPSRGPCSKYVLDDPTIDIKRGTLELTWGQTREEAESYEGVACDLSSDGHKALVQATFETLGLAKPYSISGSLPLIKSNT